MKIPKPSIVSCAGVLLFGVFGMFLLFGCLKDGIKVNRSDEFQLVVVPSAEKVELGDTVSFDILLLGERVEADLSINNEKVAGTKYVFVNEGLYSVFAQRDGARNSDTIDIIVGDINHLSKLDLVVVGVIESPTTGAKSYSFSVESNDSALADASIYVDEEEISEARYTFTAREESYWVYAHKDGYVNSDTLEIKVGQPQGSRLLLSASKTEVAEGEAVTFRARYKILGDMATLWTAEFYINGTKISEDTYTFNAEGEYEVIAKGEGYQDSDPIIITVTKGSVSVYVSGSVISTTTGKRFGIYWTRHAGTGVSFGLAEGQASDANKANAIAVHNGDIYIAGATADYPRNHFSAQYWKRSSSGLTVTTLIEGNAEATAVAINEGNIYMGGNNEGHPVYWKNGSLVDLAESGSKDWFTASGIATYKGEVYISGGTPADDAPLDSKAFYWKNNALNRTSLITDGKGAVATGITVYNGIVYVSGIGMSEIGRQAIYWINGDMVKLTSGTEDVSMAYDIKVANGVVYACGVVREKGRSYAAYWKDGKMVKITNGAEVAEGLGIAVAPNGDVYVAGWESHGGGYGSVAKYWKVDNTNQIEEVALLKETSESKANSIYLAID